ncbi:hypothetical protein LTR75_012458, partial [Friedmanniomyces endolithicus]
GMVHLLLRPPHPLLPQALACRALPRLQFPPGHQVPPRRRATNAIRRQRPCRYRWRWWRRRRRRAGDTDAESAAGWEL